MTTRTRRDDRDAANPAPLGQSYTEFMAEQAAAAAQVFAPGALVRLRADVGSKAEQSTTYRVDRLPNPNAKRKADRAYGLAPVGGGRPTAAGPELLRPASPSEIAAANAVRDVETFVVGELAVPRENGVLRGADMFTQLVVIGVGVKGYTLARLGGDGGRSYSNVPAVWLQKIQP